MISKPAPDTRLACFALWLASIAAVAVALPTATAGIGTAPATASYARSAGSLAAGGPFVIIEAAISIGIVSLKFELARFGFSAALLGGLSHSSYFGLVVSIGNVVIMKFSCHCFLCYFLNLS